MPDTATIEGVADTLFGGDRAWRPTRQCIAVAPLRVIDWFIGITTRRRYEILDRRFFDGGFVQQHVLHATAAEGSSISMRVCIVIKVGDDGLISRIDEYFDPAEMAPLLT